MNVLNSFRPSRQQGAALIIAMVLLMIMMLAAASSLRSSNQQERMASNTYDRDLAFQAAEAALRMGEDKLANITGIPNSGCAFDATMQIWGQPTNSCSKRWENPDNFADVNDLNLITSQTSLQFRPVYMIEFIGDGPCAAPPRAGVSVTTTCHNFRITAKSWRGVAGSGDRYEGRAAVTLQSIYASP